MTSTRTYGERADSIYEEMRLRSLAFAKEREAKKAERLKEKLERSVPERYRDARLDKKECSSWLEGYSSGERRNLVMMGPNGTHKTTNAYALFMALMRSGTNCTFGTMGAHLRFIKTAYDKCASEQDALDALCGVPVLFVDDLCKERATEWASEQAFEIFNARAEKRLPTVITTNSSSNEIAVHFGSDGQAILSRIAGGAVFAKFDGRDDRVCSTN